MDLEWLKFIVFIVGLIILGWYQKYRIEILEKELKSQTAILSNAKTFMDLFDPAKLKEYKAMEIESLRDKISSLETSKKEIEEKFENKGEDLSQAVSLAMASLDYVPFHQRELLIKKIPRESNLHKAFAGYSNVLKNIEDKSESRIGVLQYLYLTRLLESSGKDCPDYREAKHDEKK